jgi:hypothetical protein
MYLLILLHVCDSDGSLDAGFSYCPLSEVHLIYTLLLDFISKYLLGSLLMFFYCSHFQYEQHL